MSAYYAGESVKKIQLKLITLSETDYKALFKKLYSTKLYLSWPYC